MQKNQLVSIAAVASLLITSCASAPMREPAQAAPAKVACDLPKAMTPEETEAYLRFYSVLSQMLPYYGKPVFEERLRSLLVTHWPSMKTGQVSYLFFERVRNLVDRARLQNVIALTIGTDAPEWQDFDWLVHSIYVHQGTGNNLLKPLAPTAQKLIKRLAAWKWKTPGTELLRAEAVLRATDHYIQLVRWRAINGSIIDERAAESAQTAALLGIGAVGGAVIVGTTIFSGPIVAGAGAIGASAGAGSSPVVAGLLVKLAESVAAAGLGLVGAPAAVATQGAYRTYTDAAKRSANERTSFACELDRQVSDWQGRVGGELVSSALYGAALGAGGGAVIATHSVVAKFVLVSAGAGTAVAQAYALGKASLGSVKAYYRFKEAEAAELAGKTEEAKRLLREARDFAQEAGDQGLQSIFLATLSVQMGMSFREAFRAGESAIRQLWASSADTVPSAMTSIQDLVSSPPASIPEP